MPPPSSADHPEPLARLGDVGAQLGDHHPDRGACRGVALLAQVDRNPDAERAVGHPTVLGEVAAQGGSAEVEDDVVERALAGLGQRRERSRDDKLAGTRIRQQVAELDRRIKAQVQALEDGIEPELVTERISELRLEKSALEAALAEVGDERQAAEDEQLAEQLNRLPDLSKSLKEAPPELKRQVFQAFDLQISYDKVERRVEISTTVSEAVAEAFENAKALRLEGSGVTVTDIAGAQFVSRYHPRIVERVAAWSGAW